MKKALRIVAPIIALLSSSLQQASADSAVPQACTDFWRYACIEKGNQALQERSIEFAKKVYSDHLNHVLARPENLESLRESLGRNGDPLFSLDVAATQRNYRALFEKEGAAGLSRHLSTYGIRWPIWAGVKRPWHGTIIWTATKAIVPWGTKWGFPELYHSVYVKRDGSVGEKYQKFPLPTGIIGR